MASGSASRSIAGRMTCLNVLWRLVERFLSELAPRGGLLGHEELAQVPVRCCPTAAPEERRVRAFSSLRRLLPLSGSG